MSLFLRSLLAVAFASIIASPASAQSPDSLTAAAAPIYQELAALKGVTAPGVPPPVLLKSRADTRRFIEQELDRRYSAARVEAERKGMIAWGLIPADYDLRRLFVEMMEEQLAAYYDPRAKVMVLADWLPPDQQQVALVHELVHALQDREIPLETFLAPLPGAEDQVLARQALIEGEAVALSFELVLKSQGAQLTSLPDLGPLKNLAASGAAGATIAAAPKFLRDLLTFPYIEGLTFAFELRKRQPWSAMSALYRDPPRSTSQILNPQKRLGTREDPVPIKLPDVGSIAPGAKEVTTDELGEFGLGAVLGLQLGDPAGPAAARGWRGDQYRVWEDASGRLILVYLVAMESEARARALAATYATALEKRHAALGGKRAADAAGTLSTWRDGERVYIVEARGPELLVIEQMPSARADAARDAIWRSRSRSNP